MGFVAWPGVGWIVMSVMAAQAAGLRKAYNELKDTIADGEKENAETMRVVRNVTTLIEQATDIDGKMSSAITAMGELSELFGNNATCYEKIAFYLNAMDSGVKSDSGNNRRAFVNLSLKKTVEWLGEVSNSYSPSFLSSPSLPTEDRHKIAWLTWHNLTAQDNCSGIPEEHRA